MIRFFVALLSVGTLCLPAQVLADCRAIVADTVAELRAGAAEWNDEMERLARAAAGSACVKAGGDGNGRGAQVIKEQPVHAGDGTEVAEAAANDTATEASADGKTEKGEDDESWYPLKGIKFNKVSASPNKKPYERRREVNEPDQ